MFNCGNNSFISIQLVCEGTIDCLEAMVNDKSKCSCSIKLTMLFLSKQVIACNLYPMLLFKEDKHSKSVHEPYITHTKETNYQTSIELCRESYKIHCLQEISCFDTSDICVFSYHKNLFSALQTWKSSSKL